MGGSSQPPRAGPTTMGLGQPRGAAAHGARLGFSLHTYSPHCAHTTSDL